MKSLAERMSATIVKALTYEWRGGCYWLDIYNQDSHHDFACSVLAADNLRGLHYVMTVYEIDNTADD